MTTPASQSQLAAQLGLGLGCFFILFFLFLLLGCSVGWPTSEQNRTPHHRTPANGAAFADRRAPMKQ